MLLLVGQFFSQRSLLGFCPGKVVTLPPSVPGIRIYFEVLGNLMSLCCIYPAGLYYKTPLPVPCITFALCEIVFGCVDLIVWGCDSGCVCACVCNMFVLSAVFVRVCVRTLSFSNETFLNFITYTQTV